MKKTLFALAALGAFAGAASAQSSVQLFGTVDLAARYVKNGDVKRTDLASNGNSTSRLGVRGVEDLGGGLKAGFWLEAAVNPDSGTADSSRFWGRRSTVSLMGDFGEVRLGRDKMPTQLAFEAYDVFGATGIADINTTYRVPSGITVAANSRADNAVQYFLPGNLNGVYGSLAVAAGEGVTGGKYMGGRLGWASGPVDVSVAYGQNEITDSDDFKRFVVGGSYDFQVVKVLANYQETKFQDQKDRHMTVGASVPFGVGEFKASYSKIDGRGGAIADRDADQFAIGYVHNLSKRTALYTTYAYIKNDGTANYVVADNGATSMTGRKSQGVDVGIRHSF
ncbi:porin [Aquincola tertiaricarbonis]|uniref:Porin n=1 Tax=Aquincola tertiaricarbonis TaxID=391953 RepID=A0ABY4SCT6_AQUTE|nr:porin [Aquincola tertiaricarbonis]URI10405.1 porin [Aquincola tertiaricarbonis]